MVVAFYASARSLQLGPAIAVLTFTSVSGNIVALLGGILVFRDPIGHTPLQVAARVAAFSLVILGAALLPGRYRAGTPAPTDTELPSSAGDDRNPAAGRELKDEPGRLLSARCCAWRGSPGAESLQPRNLLWHAGRDAPRPPV